MPPETFTRAEVQQIINDIIELFNRAADEHGMCLEYDNHLDEVGRAVSWQIPRRIKERQVTFTVVASRTYVEDNLEHRIDQLLSHDGLNNCRHYHVTD